ncbi:hypothetical protein LMG28138_02210 [Pararobbsia alpina]|uniref:Leucine-binding protein domain-containing protein n=1 Tax=Pararobbsia alpina TaxID=621374 RepID=A0A6S7BEW2_9BURK|nr:hypothetical protein LMG28138_02210 [Pararobbsia alpina]
MWTTNAIESTFATVRVLWWRTVADGYAIQREWASSKLADGRKATVHKMGLDLCEPRLIVVEQIKAKRVGIIDDRTAFGQGLADAFEKGVKEANGNIVDREFTNDKAVDFRSILTTLKSKNVDVIFFGGLDEQGAMLVKQMRSLAMRTQLFGAGALKSNTFLQIAGPAGEGTQDLEPGPALDKLPAAQNFGKRYKAGAGRKHRGDRENATSGPKIV